MQSQYEQGKKDELEKDIRNFRNYMKSKIQLNERKRQTFMNSVLMVEKLIKTSTKLGLGNLKLEIENLKLIGNKDWLLEKIKEKQIH